jgi:uncharacterized phage protein gp47/JayE
MTDVGLTTTGFVRPLQADLAADILTDQRGTISAQLDGSESTVIGNLNNIFADQLAQVWELLEEVVNMLDPDNATGSRFVALSALTGVFPGGATKGLVTATVNLAAATTFAAGALTAHVLDDPTNRWINRDAVTSAGAGNYSAVFESEFAGSAAVAAAGTLTVIATPVTGWISVTNAADATPGTDGETEESLRIRRDASLARAGSGTVDAIRADVTAVTGVLQANVEENTTDAPVGALSAHSFRAVVWDGSPAAADNDEIAQAIFDTKPAGIVSIGTQSGTAVQSDGTLVTVNFERATEVPIYVSANISSTTGVAASAIKAALLAVMPTLVGGDVIYNKLAGAVFIDGVDDYVSFTIGTAPSPVGTSNIMISATQIATLAESNIVLTGDVS